VSRRYGVEINMHLNPTYAAFGTPLEEAFGDGTFTPPTLESIRDILCKSAGTAISIFVGLNDEGLSVPGGSCISDPEHELVAAINSFNRTQDLSAFSSASES
jgi:uncharacterized Fe-S cluster-containing MiaB family protein